MYVMIGKVVMIIVALVIFAMIPGIWEHPHTASAYALLCAGLLASLFLIINMFLTKDDTRKIMERFDNIDAKLEKLDDMSDTLQKILKILKERLPERK